MAKKLFITGTGTDIGKTYVTGLILKKLQESGRSAAYYKAAMSGNERDADGNLLQTLESDENGIVRAEHLQPGTYYLQETETLKGYTLSGDVRKLVIDEHYKISEEMPQWVNYTTIQTGVQLAASGVMLIGIALMLASGTMLLMRRRRKA